VDLDMRRLKTMVEESRAHLFRLRGRSSMKKRRVGRKAPAAQTCEKRSAELRCAQGYVVPMFGRS
jgi:hypothetical protein